MTHVSGLEQNELVNNNKKLKKVELSNVLKPQSVFYPPSTLTFYVVIACVTNWRNN